MKTNHAYTVAPEDQADHEIGLELIRVLNLRVKRENGRVKTAWGDKNPCGLARVVQAIAAEPPNTRTREALKLAREALQGQAELLRTCGAAYGIGAALAAITAALDE